MKYAKAITAFIVTALSLVVGDDVSGELDTSVLETLVVSVLVSLGVYAVPNRPAIRG